MLYSAKAKGFFPLDMQAMYEAAGTWPTDGAPVTAEDHAALMVAQAAGKLIQPDAQGNPVAVDHPAPTVAQLAIAARAKRDALLSATDWTQLGDVPDATKKPWQIYRQALRDVSTQTGFPTTVVWPTAPV